MTKDEALKMAIEAIDYKGVRDSEPYWEMMNKTIKACKEALEQPAQEPVAWNEEEFNAIAYAYRAFPSSEVKMVSEKYKALVDYVLSIANHAPSWQGNKEFVGLSDNEKLAIIRKWKDAHTMREQELIGLGDAFEQALKDKNT